MRISVITPVFNGEKYIKETIDSVLKAIGKSDIEYLVINDGSTDRTLEILKVYENKIGVITQDNQGESSAVNRGFHEALGDFLLVVSADDPLFTPAIFEGVIDFFENNPEIVVWYPNWQMIDHNGDFVREVIVEEYSDEKMIGRFMCLPGPGAFIRRSAALQIGGRREKWKFVGDYDFWLRISRIGYLKKRDALLAQWRFHDESTSIAQRGKKMFSERINVIDEFVNEFYISKQLGRKARAHAHYFASLLAYHSKDVSARSTLLKAFWIRRGWIEESQIKVILYILLMPLSFYLKPILRMLFKNSIRARK
jgi:glycosyltransferase involved in cell wall biosynthesis